MAQSPQKDEGDWKSKLNLPAKVSKKAIFGKFSVKKSQNFVQKVEKIDPKIKIFALKSKFSVVIIKFLA